MAVKIHHELSLLDQLHYRASRLLRRETVCLYTRHHAGPDHAARTAGIFDLVIPGPDEIERYSADLQQHFKLEQAVLEERLRRGHQVLLALHEQQVVAMLWLAFDSISVQEIGAELALGPKEFITYHAFTRSAWRGLGLSTALNERAYRHAWQQHKSVQLAWRQPNNRSSMRVAQKLGQTRICEVHSLWFLGFRLWRSVTSYRPTAPALRFMR
ncbi:MAG: hypothetical protein RJA44_1292 [Pseudomonadota bacterium]